MDKEELRKEAQESYIKLLRQNNCGQDYNCEIYNDGYIAGAESREKRIAELEEKISVLLSCKKCPDNKGGYICQKEYEDKCLAQKIQYIKELQEENAELKKEVLEVSQHLNLTEIEWGSGTIFEGGIRMTFNEWWKESLAKGAVSSDEEEIAKYAFEAGLKAGRPEWHKVADGDLPKENKLYLVEMKDNGLAIAYFNGRHWETKYNLGDFGHCVETVIAWCEIPKFKE